jgi:Uncharacterized protein conserved in bacteria (DUF2147)
MTNSNRVAALVAILLLCATHGFAQTNEAQFVGFWLAKEANESTIELYKGPDGALYGKVTASKKPENVGKVLFAKGKYEANKQRYVGTITPPENGLTLNCHLYLTSDQRIKVVASKFLLTKTIYWTKKP